MVEGIWKLTGSFRCVLEEELIWTVAGKLLPDHSEAGAIGAILFEYSLRISSAVQQCFLLVTATKQPWENEGEL